MFEKYTIEFNGNNETYFVSKKEIAFDYAQEIIKQAGKTPVTVSYFWETDKNGIPRWKLIKEAGFDGLGWMQVLDSNFAYYFRFGNGTVNLSSRGLPFCAVCR